MRPLVKDTDSGRETNLLKEAREHGEVIVFLGTDDGRDARRSRVADPLSRMRTLSGTRRRYLAEAECRRVGCDYRTNLVALMEEHDERCSKPLAHEAEPRDGVRDCPDPSCADVIRTRAQERVHRSRCEWLPEEWQGEHPIRVKGAHWPTSEGEG